METEIAPGVYSVPATADSFMGMYAPKAYLVVAGKAALIDTGYHDSEAIKRNLDYIQRLAPSKLSYILVTHPHPDHMGGCGIIKEATGAQVVVHSLGAARAEELDAKADILVNHGDTIDIGGALVEVIHAPGHTRDSVCYYLRDREILFTGDNILGFGTPVISGSGDMAQYIDTLKKLLKYQIRLLCPGHGPLVREPRRKINELIAHRMEREQQLLSLLGRGNRKIPELVAAIYPELDKRLVELAGKQVLAHLNKLVKEDKVSASGEEYTLK